MRARMFVYYARAYVRVCAWCVVAQRHHNHEHNTNNKDNNDNKTVTRGISKYDVDKLRDMSTLTWSLYRE
jgi:hypothetical protein